MKKLIGFYLCVFAMQSFAEFSLVSRSGSDTLFGRAGQWVEESYGISGDNIKECYATIAGGWERNILDSSSFTITVADYVNSGYDYAFTFKDTASIHSFLTIKGKIKSDGVAIGFMMYAKTDVDTARKGKMFHIVPGYRTTNPELSNGDNEVQYNGVHGFLVCVTSYQNCCFVSDAGIRQVLPWYGNPSWQTDRFTMMIAASWNWDLSKIKQVSSAVMSKYPIAGNVLVEPGFNAMYNRVLDSYYESTALGKVRPISHDDAFAKYGTARVDTIIDQFLADYTIDNSTDAVSSKSKIQLGMKVDLRILSACNVNYDIAGRNIAKANRAVYGLNIVRLSNGAMVKNMYLNRK